MADRSVAVKVRAEVAEFRKNMADAAAAGEKLAKSLENSASSANKAGKAADDAARSSASAFSKMSQSAKEHEQAWNRAGTSLLTAGTLITAGVGVMISRYAAFDKQMSAVQAATHETAANMGLLRQAAIEAGADTAFSAQEAGKGIEELAKAGVTTKDVLSGGLSGALSLAAAGSLDVGQAAEIAATAMSQFGLSGKDIPHIADLLAAGAGKAQGEVSDLANALKYVGPIAKGMGISIEETTGTLAAFASKGIISEQAGTSLRGVLSSLTSPSKQAKAEMDRLGISLYDGEGKFVGISGAAEQLKKAYDGMPQAAKNASLGIVFSNDQLTAGRVLAEEGAAGIQKWTDAVNSAGYAAATAAIKQDNLAGDFEKLGGSLDSVFLKSGSAANDVLRSLTQSAEDLVDMIGSIPAPVLQSTLVIAGLTGGALLLGGAFFKAVPAIMETRAAFATLAKDSPKLVAGLGRLATAASWVGLAVTGVSLLANALTERAPVESTETWTKAVVNLANATSSVDSKPINDLFTKWDHSVGAAGSSINSLASAVERITHPQQSDATNNWADDMFGWTGLAKSEVGQVEERLGKLGTTLGDLVSNGGAGAAAKAFSNLADQFKNNGKESKDALEYLPDYKKALEDQASSLGVTLDSTELLNYALGQTPQKMLDAAGASNTYTDANGQGQIVTEAMAKSLADLGLSAQGAVTDLGKFVDLLTQAGLLTLSARDAQRNYSNTLLEVGLNADGTGGKIGALGTAFDNSTAQGIKNQAMFDGVAKAGIAVIDTMAKATDAYGNNTHTQAELQTQLGKNYDSLIATAGQFGITGAAADKLARDVLKIPPKANINTWMSDYAKKMAEQTTGAIKAIPDYKQSRIDIITTQITNAPKGSSKPLAYATGGAVRGFAAGGDPTGGAVSGPGTGTSDSIPALLSNGEHVLTASDVLAMGGQESVYRFRGLVRAGLLPKFAAGGHLGESANARANRLWREAEAARKARAAELAKSRQYRNEQANSLVLDDERGQSWRSVNDLSSGYGFSDRLRSVAASGNLNTQRDYLNRVAYDADKALRGLQARSDSLGKSLDSAKDKLTELTQVRDKVRDNLAGGFDIGQAASFAARSGGGIITVQARASKYLATVQAFSAKLAALQKKGYSGAILDEIASMGSVDGSRAADALLAGSAAQVVGLNKTYTDIGMAASQAGDAVTNAMFKGGVNAAAGIVKGLQSQQGAIEKQMMNIGLGMEKALKKALGIRSPSRKMLAITDNVTGTAVDGLKAGVPAVSAQAKMLGEAMIDAPSKQLAGATIGGRSFAGSSSSGTGLDSAALDRLTEAVKSARAITVQTNSTTQATAMAVAREMRGF